MRRILKYPGSKWNIAGRLVNMIPPHHSYVEPFFGSGAVLFNKPPSDIETINDLDSNVTNLFLCIQEGAEHGKPRKEVVWINYRYEQQLSFEEDFPEVLP